jgi:hypothetical protein
MSDALFTHDVFLSHSAKDKAVVRPLAERLRKDGLKVWFDEWEIAKAQAAQRQTESDHQPLAFGLHPLPCTPITGPLAQFLYINRLPTDHAVTWRLAHRTNAETRNRSYVPHR